MSSLHPKFSHIYVERQALEHQRTEDLVKRLSKRETTKIIPITSYTEIFNRNKQNFAIQKDVQKYILALRQEDFLYAGSSAAPDFGNTNFYYNTLVLNCLYNCEYCYLQGMFRSAHLVVFVNNETFLAETEQALQRLGEMYVCLSYDTDLLAFENLLGYCKEWIEFTRVQTGLTIEIRTKSVAISSLATCKPCDRVILAWTLSPDSIQKRFELGTPSLAARIAAMKKMIALGWRVRCCIDPILPIGENWKEEYRDLIRLLRENLPADSISELSLGTFRIAKQYLKRLGEVRPSSLLVHQTLHTSNGISALPTTNQQHILDFVTEEALNWLPASRIHKMVIPHENS